MVIQWQLSCIFSNSNFISIFPLSQTWRLTHCECESFLSLQSSILGTWTLDFSRLFPQAWDKETPLNQCNCNYYRILSVQVFYYMLFFSLCHHDAAIGWGFCRYDMTTAETDNLEQKRNNIHIFLALHCHLTALLQIGVWSKSVLFVY